MAFPSEWHSISNKYGAVSPKTVHMRGIPSTATDAIKFHGPSMYISCRGAVEMDTKNGITELLFGSITE